MGAEMVETEETTKILQVRHQQLKLPPLLLKLLPVQTQRIAVMRTLVQVIPINAGITGKIFVAITKLLWLVAKEAPLKEPLHNLAEMVDTAIIALPEKIQLVRVITTLMLAGLISGVFANNGVIRTIKTENKKIRI